jgi:hypothetical protein
MLVAEVHGRERAANVGLGAGDSRLCYRSAPCVKPLVASWGRGGHATQHARAPRRPFTCAGYRHTCVW